MVRSGGAIIFEMTYAQSRFCYDFEVINLSIAEVERILSVDAGWLREILSTNFCKNKMPRCWRGILESGFGLLFLCLFFLGFLFLGGAVFVVEHYQMGCAPAEMGCFQPFSGVCVIVFVYGCSLFQSVETSNT